MEWTCSYCGQQTSETHWRTAMDSTMFHISSGEAVPLPSAPLIRRDQNTFGQAEKSPSEEVE